MNIKKILIAAIVGLGFTSASAQECNGTETVFLPNWYIQVQGGAQYTLGETAFDKLVSPNAQVALGYQFTPVLGTRLAVNAWQSKGASEIGSKEYSWKWNYVAPSIDLTVNLSNLLCGFNPNRVLNVGIYGGIGANVGFKNDEAATADAQMRKDLGYPAIGSLAESQYLRKLWDGSKARFMAQAGVNVDFRVSEKVNLGVEVSANTLNDAYNSKKAGNADWYFNALAGVKVNLGKTYTTREKKCTCEPQVVEKIVEKIVEKKVPVEAKATIEPLRRDIFFTISSTKVTESELVKVMEIADYLNKYPQAKVKIVGYADKGTGNATINNKLSQNRAAIVAETLKTKYNIAADRITTDFKGDTEQPYTIEVLNRVSICVAE